MKTIVALAAASTLVVGLAACTSDSSDEGGASHSATARAQELKIQFPGPPISLDPKKAGGGTSTAFISLAYDPLIYLAPDGSLVPDLATSWKFTDDKNMVFEVKLRDGVTFADGSKLDAEAVKASMEYVLKDSTNVQFGKVASIDAVDASTVRITYAHPFPGAADSLTQYLMLGNIIGPKGLSDPKGLLKSMDGTGPYLYKPGKSVPNSTYVYERNPDYWNPKAQMYNAVSIHIIADPNATLSAIQTGQVDTAGGAASTVDAAKAAGIKVVPAPFFNWSLYLADTKGTIAPALKSQKVRRAIALSIDRAKITKAVVGKFGMPNGQPMNKGTLGYVDGAGFSHNLSEAKKLLAEAGYPNGFTLTIVTSTGLDPNSVLAQAIANSIEQTGIKVKLKVFPTVPQFIQEAQSKKYPAVLFPLTGTDMGQVYTSLNGFRTPFGYDDSRLESLYQQSLVAGADDRLAIYKKMTKRMIEDAVVVPVVTEENLTYVGPKVANVKASPLNPNPLPTGPEAKYAWHAVK